jgi:cbb3-type cytochrome oxidase subunit 3
MSPAIVSLLAVTFGFTALVVWVYWPSRKSRVEAFGSIPLAEDSTAPASQKEQPK